MNRYIITLFVCIVLFFYFLLPALAEDQDQCISPMLSMLVGNNGTITFANEEITLITKSVTKNSEIVTKVTDETGQLLLTSTVTQSHLTLVAPGVKEPKKITFPEPLLELPENTNASKLAAYIALRLSEESLLSDRLGNIQYDSPGCDGVPGFLEGGLCTLSCCADHDACYDKYDCTANSWMSITTGSIGVNNCDYCNGAVVNCILFPRINPPLCNQRCYDHKCSIYFDCGYNHCDCKSPCTGMISYKYTGTLINDLGTYPAGTGFSASFSYNMSNPELNGLDDPTIALYASNIFTFRIGNEYIRLSSSERNGEGSIQIDNYHTFDGIMTQHHASKINVIVEGGVIGGIDFSEGRFDFDMSDSTATVFDSDNLPDHNLTYSDFTFSSFVIRNKEGASAIICVGTINTLQGSKID